jgi:hypothetical protein
VTVTGQPAVLVLNAACRAALEAVAGSVASWLEVEEAESKMQYALDNVLLGDKFKEHVMKVLTDCGIQYSRQDFSEGWTRASLQSEISKQEQDAEVAVNRCLLAIGDHIEGVEGATWAGVLATTPLLWDFVALATRNELDGQQLALKWRRLQDSRCKHTGMPTRLILVCRE